jgi:hypothetical protein
MSSFSSLFFDLPADTITRLFPWALTTFLVGSLTRYVYLVTLHPLAKYPGPRLAAISNTWYAYYWMRGKWPWTIEQILKQYGDVVRVGPNELVFVSPQAAKGPFFSSRRPVMC